MFQSCTALLCDKQSLVIILLGNGQVSLPPRRGLTFFFKRKGFPTAVLSDLFFLLGRKNGCSCVFVLEPNNQQGKWLQVTVSNYAFTGREGCESRLLFCCFHTGRWIAGGFLSWSGKVCTKGTERISHRGHGKGQLKWSNVNGDYDCLDHVELYCSINRSHWNTKFTVRLNAVASLCPQNSLAKS